MAMTDAEVRSSITGDFYYAPIGTPKPPAPSLDNPLPATWKPVGYFSDAGATKSHSADKTDKFAFQNADIVRTLTGETYATIALELIQENKDNLEFIYNSTVDGVDGGIDVRVGSAKKQSFCLVIIDGEDLLYIWIPVGEISEIGDTVYASGELRVYPITVKAFGSNGRHYREMRSSLVVGP